MFFSYKLRSYEPENRKKNFFLFFIFFVELFKKSYHKRYIRRFTIKNHRRKIHALYIEMHI